MVEFICEHCRKIFPTKGAKQYHYQKEHRKAVSAIHEGESKPRVYEFNEERKLVCSCGKEYSDVRSFKKHVEKCNGKRVGGESDKRVIANYVTDDGTIIESFKFWKLEKVEILASRLHGVVICTHPLCTCGLTLDQVPYHLQRHHKVEKQVLESVNQEIMDFLNDCEACDLSKVNGSVLPLPRLEIYDGFRCSFCTPSVYFTTKDAFRRHLSLKHKDQSELEVLESVKVQKLNKRSKNSIVFPVSTEEVSVFEYSDSTYESIMGELDISYNCGKVPKFMEALGWSKFFEVKNWVNERAFIADTEICDETLSECATSWFNIAYQALKEQAHMKYSLMLQIGYEKYETNIDRRKEKVKVFGALEKRESADRYLKVLIAFFQFVMRKKDDFNLTEFDNSSWTINKVHSLLVSIFFKKYNVSLNRFTDPTYLFMAYHAMSERVLEFKEAKDLTGTLAALKFIIRLLVFKEIIMKPEIAAELLKNRYQDSLLIYVKKNSSCVTPFGMISEMMGLLSIAESGLIAKSNVQMDHENPGESIIFNGLNVTRSGLRSSIKSAINTANQIVQSLLLGFNIEFIDGLLEKSSWIEPLRSQVRGGSILRSPIVEAVAKKFIASKPDFENEMKNKYKINNYFERVAKYRELLLLLVHMTSGQPARATELASMTITNSNNVKSLYWRKASIVTCTSYNKINGITGSDHIICRALPLEVTKLMLIDLAIVKVVERMLLRKMNEFTESSKNAYDYHLWVQRGKVSSAADIRAAIRSGLVKYCNLNLYLSEYRHVAIAFSRTLKATSLSEEVLSMLMDYQTGHSSQTAKTCYAVTEENLSRLSADTLEKHLTASKLWWQFMGLDSEIPEIVRDSRDSRVDNLKEDFEMLKKMFDKQQDLISSFLPVMKTIAEGKDDRKDIRNYSVADSLKVKYIIRSYLRKADAEFLSVWQGYAIGFALQGKGNALVVLPTGGGKTMVAEVYAYAYPKKTCFMFFPATALDNDMKERFGKTNLKFQDWKSWQRNPSNPYPSIFLCMIDDLMCPDMISLISVLEKKGLLGSFFIDEIHLAIEWRSFRTPLHYLPKLLEFNAPILGLTATIRRRDECMLKPILGDSFLTIRHPNTLRTDITYNVRNYGKMGNGYQRSLLLKLRDIVKNYLEQLGPDERMIILTMSKNEVISICRLLESDAISHDSSLTDEEKDVNLRKWKLGEHKILVGTSGISVGINYKFVRNVISYGLCYSVMEVVQVAGRAARDNEITGTYDMITCQEYQKHTLSFMKENRQEIEEVIEFCRGGICRRNFLSNIMDDCLMLCNEKNACDTCKNGADETNIHEANDNRNVLQRGNESSYNEMIMQQPISSTILIIEEMKKVIICISKFCPICLTEKDEFETHDVNRCPYMVKRCLKCYSQDHSVKDCTLNIKCDTKGSLFCFGCLFPFQYENHFIHPKSNEYNLGQCVLRDKAKLIAWYVFRNVALKKRLFPPQLTFESENEYCNWLGQTRYPLSNLGLLLCWWYKFIMTLTD